MHMLSTLVTGLMLAFLALIILISVALLAGAGDLATRVAALLGGDLFALLYCCSLEEERRRRGEAIGRAIVRGDRCRGAPNGGGRGAEGRTPTWTGRATPTSCAAPADGGAARRRVRQACWILICCACLCAACIAISVTLLTPLLAR